MALMNPSSIEPMAEAMKPVHVRSLDDDADTNQILPAFNNNNKYASGTSYQDYVANNILRILDDEQVSDVIFEVEGECFYGIRALFASQSDVFRRMLYGGMLEADPSNHVVLTDVTVPAFKYLRSTFYNVFNHDRATELQCDMVVDVLFAAHKYLIEPLIEKCLEFIKRIQNMKDWFLVLREFENSPFQYQASLFLSQILNDGASPYILQNKSVLFLQSAQFKQLKCDTVIVLIRSDYLAAKEHDVWDSLIRWCRHNAVMAAAAAPSASSMSIDDDREQKEEAEHKTCPNSPKVGGADGGDEQKNSCEALDNAGSDVEMDRTLNETERVLMTNFINHIRFKRMDATYFKQHIVDNQILGESQVIQLMFAREDGTKWSSEFNDRDRERCKLLDAFELSEVCLSLAQIQALGVGDVVDFRDHYGLFCSATIIETDHSSNRVKIHYNHWGTTYDEWYTYQHAGIIDGRDEDEEEVRNADQSTNGDRVRLSQKDLCSRFARFGSVTKRNIKRQVLRERIERFHNNANSEAYEVQIRPSKFFWKKNENYITNKAVYLGKWLNARFRSYKGSAPKYSQHIKVAVIIHGEQYDYWIHPDSAQEIRPLCVANDCT